MTDHPAPLPEKPRTTQGLVAPILRQALAVPWRLALRGLLATGITADQLTVLSLATSVVIAVLIARGQRLLPGLLLIVSGLMDIFDGSIARARGSSGPRGAWLDSVMDRGSDAAVLGALFLSLAWQGRTTQAALAIAALGVSLLVSHIRAEAECVGVKMGEGLFARVERMVAMMIGLTAPGALEWALLALVVLGGATLIQRLVIAWRALAA